MAASDNGLYGVLMACPQDPETPPRRSRNTPDNPASPPIYLPTAGVNPLWGHRKYDPILAAAEEADLPLCLHSVTVVSPAFPCQLDQFENHFARQMLSHAFAMMANLVSLMHTGVPARYPETEVRLHRSRHRLGSLMTWRMDNYYQEYRRMVPLLERKPSEYMREQMWFATQPIEEPDDPAHLVDTIRTFGEDRDHLRLRLAASRFRPPARNRESAHVDRDLNAR